MFEKKEKLSYISYIIMSSQAASKRNSLFRVTTSHSKSSGKNNGKNENKNANSNEMWYSKKNIEPGNII